MQHLAERLAGLVPQVQALAELCASASVNGTDILNVRVYTRSEERALRQRGNAARSAIAEEAEDVDEEELYTDGEEHGRGGNGEDADGRVARTGSCDELDHDEEPADGEIPVEPVELQGVSIMRAQS